LLKECKGVDFIAKPEPRLSVLMYAGEKEEEKERTVRRKQNV
jgi:hypothetical protein